MLMSHVFIFQLCTEDIRLTCGPGRPTPAAPASPCRKGSARVILKLVNKKRCGVQRRETNKIPPCFLWDQQVPAHLVILAFPGKSNKRLEFFLNCRPERQINKGGKLVFSPSLTFFPGFPSPAGPGSPFSPLGPGTATPSATAAPRSWQLVQASP